MNSDEFTVLDSSTVKEPTSRVAIVKQFLPVIWNQLWERWFKGERTSLWLRDILRGLKKENKKMGNLNNRGKKHKVARIQKEMSKRQNGQTGQFSR